MKICQYCVLFHTSKVGRGGDGVFTCTATNKLVKGSSEACKFFELSSLFYCEKNSEWIAPEVCFNRRENPKAFIKRAGCKKCRQFSNEIIFHYGKRSKRRLKMKVGRKLKREIEV